GGFPGAGGQRVRVEGFNVEDLGDLGDLFGGLFGGIGGREGRRRGRRGASAARGSDLETEVRISFDDAMRGTTVPVKIRGAAPCATCGGSGAEPGTSPITCPQCGGSGSVAVDQGPFQFAQPCPRFGGGGRVREPPPRTYH